MAYNNGQNIQDRITPLDLQTEHRMTSLESGIEHLDESHNRTVCKLEATNKRLRLHEKAILVIAGALQVLFQEKFPHVAKVIRGILMP